MVEIIIRNNNNKLPEYTREELKSLEKRGYAYIKPHEAKSYVHKCKTELKKKEFDKTRQEIRKSLHEIKQGRSFYRELQESINGNGRK